MSNWFQHFEKDEKEFVARTLEQIAWVESSRRKKLTGFLTPRESEIIRLLIGKKHLVKVDFFGGPPKTERQRAMLSYGDEEVESNDYQLQAYQIIYPEKFIQLDHRQILGSLMALGLKREKFGDIITVGNDFYFLVSSDVVPYLENNLEKIGRSSIQLKPIDITSIPFVEESWQEKMITVPSLRLDLVLAEISNISRKRSQEAILQGRVKVNWRVIYDASLRLKEADVISFRGFGRMRILQIAGATKRDKIRLNIGIRNNL